jgi:SAM-dependent methyltransferase
MTAALPESGRPHGLEPPSAWVQRWTHLLAPHARVLDLACGHGRHMQWFAAQGMQVTGVDRSPEALASASAWGQTIAADIENGAWPLMTDGIPRQFDAVVVTNYLWRELFPKIRASLAPGAVLIYETFAAGNQTVGKPSRPEFLLQPGELLRVFGDLRIIAFEDGFLAQSQRFVQRIVAINSVPTLSTQTPPARYLI